MISLTIEIKGCVGGNRFAVSVESSKAHAFYTGSKAFADYKSAYEWAMGWLAFASNDREVYEVEIVDYVEGNTIVFPNDDEQ